MFFRTTNTITLTSFLLGATLTYAQNKQANNWYFGRNAGITFNTTDGGPKAVVDWQKFQGKGCGSILIIRI